MMTDTKYTPGNWRAGKGIEDEPERWVILSDHAGKDWILATIENGVPGDTLETEGHNARLMAIAPEMHGIIRDLSRISDIRHAIALCGRAKELLARLHGEQEVDG